METFYKIFLHAYTAAAVFLTAWALVRRLRTLPEPAGTSPLTRRALFRVFAWTAGAALLSRIVLLGFCAAFGDTGWSGLPGLWNHWDGPHYMDIARYGYTNDRDSDQWLFIVFFPLYPWIVSLVRKLGVSVEAAGMAVSWAALMGAAYALYLLVRHDNGPGDARRAVKYLLIFPATVFLGAQYTESLFLLTSVSCLYALRRKRWAAAGALGMLAALTRNLGVLLVIPFVIEYFADRALIGPEWRRHWRIQRIGSMTGALWALLIPLGTVLYLCINQAVYGNPFMFLAIQKNHWSQRMDLISNVLYRSFRYARTDENLPTVLYLWLYQTVTMALTLALMPLMVRRIRLSYGVYAAAYVLIAFSASMLLSAARYIMGLAPLYPAIASLTRNKWVDLALTLAFLALAVWMAHGFTLYRMVL